MAKNYFKSYIWLLETLQSHGRLTLKELQNLWLKSSVNDDNRNLAPRTLANHIQAIADVFGIDIACDRHGNTYHIENNGDMGRNGVREWMLDALSLNNILNESVGMKDRIIFEDVPSGHNFLSTIIQAMRDRRVLEIRYRSFRKKNDEDLLLEPWCLREFKRRWYLFAYHEGLDRPHMYALDRVLSASISKQRFELPKRFNAYEMFAGVYGVRLYDDMKCQKVLLKADAMQANYFRTLPLHSSQEEVETTDGYSVFRYYLTPDYDFLQDILSFGTSVEILEPQPLREKLAETIQTLNRKYNDRTN